MNFRRGHLRKNSSRIQIIKPYQVDTNKKGISEMETNEEKCNWQFENYITFWEIYQMDKYDKNLAKPNMITTSLCKPVEIVLV